MFDGTSLKLTLWWRDIVELASKYMLFGAPFDSSRSFEPIFRLKSDIEYAHHVFRKLAVEYRGDSRASYALYAQYQKRVRQSWQMIAEQAMAEKEKMMSSRGRRRE